MANIHVFNLQSNNCQTIEPVDMTEMTLINGGDNPGMGPYGPCDGSPGGSMKVDRNGDFVSGYLNEGGYCAVATQSGVIVYSDPDMI
jgi:hypothetical protein